MGQQSKLETVSPAMRRGDPQGASAPSTSAPVSPLRAGSEFAASAGTTPLTGIRIATDRSAPVLDAEFRAVANRAVAEEEQTWADRIRKWLALTPSWMVSFGGHVALVAVLAFMVTPHLTQSSFSIDGLLVDSNQVDAISELLEEAQNEESQLLEVDVQSLSSEAAPELAETFHESELDASLLEGMQSGDGLEGFASSGLTPLESSAAGGSDGDTGDAASFFGARATGKRFIFIIDSSGSMSEEFRWQRALIELEKAMDGFGPEQEVLLLLYNSETYPMFDTAPKNLKLLPVTQKFKIALKKWLLVQRPFGRTQPAFALQYSISLKPDAIFFLSDGIIDPAAIDVIEQKKWEEC